MWFKCVLSVCYKRFDHRLSLELIWMFWSFIKLFKSDY